MFNWGLSPVEKRVRQLEKLPKSYETDLELAELQIADPLQKKLKTLKIMVEYDKLSAYEADRQGAEFMLKDYPESDRLLKLNEIDFKHEKIDKFEFEKNEATINKEPWVEIIGFDINSDNPSEGEFKLDWNSYFIEALRDKKFLAPTEEETVQLWFHEVCKNVALEAFDGQGIFNDMMQEHQEKMKLKYKQFEDEE